MVCRFNPDLRHRSKNTRAVRRPRHDLASCRRHAVPSARTLSTLALRRAHFTRRAGRLARPHEPANRCDGGVLDGLRDGQMLSKARGWELAPGNTGLWCFKRPKL